MKDEIIQDASLEALSKKSFNKYLKMLIKDKEYYINRYESFPDMHELRKKVQYEYLLLCQIQDDYKYFKARKKDIKGDECRI